MRVVISGVHGFLGGELARRFLARGDAVVGLARRRPAGLTLSAFHPFALGQAAPEGAFQGADLVIHAAHDRSPGSQALNVDGTRRLAEQARREGTGRQLFLSSVSAHADAPSEYGQAKASLEAFFAGIGGLIVRPGLVAGAGGTFGDLAALIRRAPILPVLGGNELKVVLTDVDTLFKFTQMHAGLKSAHPYNLFQPEWIGLLSLAAGIRGHLRTRTLLLPVPLGPAMRLLKWGQALGLPRTLGPENLKNLERAQGYGYASSYEELGLPLKTLDELLAGAFPA